MVHAFVFKSAVRCSSDLFCKPEVSGEIFCLFCFVIFEPEKAKNDKKKKKKRQV